MELEIRGLTRRFPGGPTAVDGVDLTLGPGVCGLLGPNGAGKTTLMRILATLERADAGGARLGELDLTADRTAWRRRLGYLPQDFGLYPDVTAERLLDHLAELKGIALYRERARTVRALLERTHLWDVRQKKLGTFSGGMKQRFGIAQALLAEPRLLIVDEPTSGLDPEERARFLDALEETGETGEGVIVLLSTHLVEDVAQLATGVAVLDRGRLLGLGPPEQEIARLRGRLWAASLDPGEAAARRASGLAVVRARRHLGRIRLHAMGESWPGSPFEAVEPDLEDFYFATLGGLLPAPGARPAA